MTKGLKMMLEAFGINIDPAEVEQFYRKLQHDIPAMAQFVGEKFQSIDERLMRIECALGQQLQMTQSEQVKKELVNGKSSENGAN